MLSQISASSGLQSHVAQDSTFSTKHGLCCHTCQPEAYEAFSDLANWTYNYQLQPTPHSGYPYDWAEQRGMEFVPMIAKVVIAFPDGSKCDMTGKHQPLCTVDQIVEAIESSETFDQSVYLLGFNQPYNQNAPSDYMEADQAAQLWSQFFVPIAEQTGLKLVSPTVNKPSTEWLQNFLKSCVDLNEDPDTPCDVMDIHYFAMHEYNCKEKSVTNFWGPQGQWYSQMQSLMGDYGGIDWAQYFEDRPLWITETNCNHSNVQNPTQEQQCQMITGQWPGYGQGSMTAYIDMPNVYRIAWWNLGSSGGNTNVAISNLWNPTTMEPTPEGQAFLANFDPVAADCYGNSTQTE